MHGNFCSDALFLGLTKLGPKGFQQLCKRVTSRFRENSRRRDKEFLIMRLDYFLFDPSPINLRAVCTIHAAEQRQRAVSAKAECLLDSGQQAIGGRGRKS